MKTLEQFLLDPSNAGIYHVPETGAASLERSAENTHFHYLVGDARGGLEPELVLGRLGSSLGFPDYYEPNLDAFDECINDFSWTDPAPGYLIVLRGLDEFREQNPHKFEQLIEILEQSVDSWREEDIPFWVFFDMRSNGLSHFPDMD